MNAVSLVEHFPFVTRVVLAFLAGSVVAIATIGSARLFLLTASQRFWKRTLLGARDVFVFRYLNASYLTVPWVSALVFLALSKRLTLWPSVFCLLFVTLARALSSKIWEQENVYARQWLRECALPREAQISAAGRSWAKRVCNEAGQRMAGTFLEKGAIDLRITLVFIFLLFAWLHSGLLSIQFFVMIFVLGFTSSVTFHFTKPANARAGGKRRLFPFLGLVLVLALLTPQHTTQKSFWLGFAVLVAVGLKLLLSLGAKARSKRAIGFFGAAPVLDTELLSRAHAFRDFAANPMERLPKGVGLFLSGQQTHSVVFLLEWLDLALATVVSAIYLALG